MNRNANILIIEDDQDARKIMRLALDDGNRQIREAANADDALAALETFFPEIILLDIHLGGTIDGLSLYEKIASQIRFREVDIRFRKTKVVIISGANSSEEIEKARNLGVVVFLKKPFSPEKLNALVGVLESSDMFIVPAVSDSGESFTVN